MIYLQVDQIDHSTVDLITCRCDMPCMICTTQIQPRKHVLHNADNTAPPPGSMSYSISYRSCRLYRPYRSSALKDLDHGARIGNLFHLLNSFYGYVQRVAYPNMTVAATFGTRVPESKLLKRNIKDKYASCEFRPIEWFGTQLRKLREKIGRARSISHL